MEHCHGPARAQQLQRLLREEEFHVASPELVEDKLAEEFQTHQG